MDIEAYKVAAESADRQFADRHPNFLKWWAHHGEKDPEPRYAVPARVAFTVARYADEFTQWQRLGSPPLPPAKVNAPGFDATRAARRMMQDVRDAFTSTPF